MYVLDPKLRPHATEKQWRSLEALAEHGSIRKAAAALGVNHSVIGRVKIAVEKKAAMHGYAPDHDMRHPVPDGYRVKGVSTLRDMQTGEAKIQWQKTEIDNDAAIAARQAALEAMLEEIPPVPSLERPEQTDPTSLANLYVITDYHIGMVAWGEECGENWDTKLAEKLLIDWFTAAIRQAPPADVGIFCQLGDYLHWDGMSGPLTPASGHVLDTDTRFQNVVRVAVRVTRQIIEMLRTKYPKVHIIMADANHDPASGVWLREMLADHHQSDENVTVDTSPDTYYCFPWGKTALFFHHGHRRSVKELSPVFVSKFKEIYGQCKYAYGHSGHLHHDKVAEDRLMTVEQHQTLAAKDSYASKYAFMSGRSAKVITYSREHGEVGRVTLTPEMVS
jgi:hypothetical protein